MSVAHPIKIGVVSNAIDVFNEVAKQTAEGQFRQLFDDLKQEGVISTESVYYEKRIFGYHEACDVATLFGREQVDAIVLLNSAFPNGHVFAALATDPYLTKIPLIVTATPEVDVGVPEWTSNAWCGAIMNNHVAKQIGRYIYPLGGFPEQPQYRDEIARVLNAARTIRLLRREYVGRFGEAPGGFHSATGDQLAYAALFGVNVETVDLTAVINTYETGTATGCRGNVAFSDIDVEQTIEAIKQESLVLIDDPFLQKSIRLYHSLKAMIEAKGFTSIAYRCWPEMNEDYIGIVPCMALTRLLADGIVSAAACESDWPIGVMQSLGTYLSGRPAACLDFVNYTGGSEIVQLGHCGVGIAGCMAANDSELMQQCAGDTVTQEIREEILSGKRSVNDAIAEHGVMRQAGQRLGPMHIGQFEYGTKTGISLLRDRDGKSKMLVFTGENSEETAKGLLYSACDVYVKNYKALHESIMEHGFPHHLAVAMGDISKELRILCDYYGIEYISPES